MLNWLIRAGVKPKPRPLMTARSPYLNELKCSQACAKEVPDQPCGDGDYGTESSCNLACEINGAAVLYYNPCWNQFKEFVDCEATHEMSCMSVGNSNVFQAEACISKYEAWKTCLPEE